MRFAVALLTLVGCIETHLVPCGDRVCAVGSQCIAGRTCATEDELVACRDLDEGMPCTSAMHDGYCFDGVCVEDLCGDEIMQVGEVCDDGNRRNGDGCSADCRSTEACGNAIVDPGEFCDCGDGSAPLPLGCRGPNADESSAVCDTTCTRRCGDEEVTGSEACDGPTVPRSCSDLGYYTGTATCTPFCAIDDSGCSGRCGDGIVQTVYGEECDGMAPTTSCVSFGRDYGVLGCSNNVCLPAIGRDCHQFGWQLLIDTDGPVANVAANMHGAVAVGSTVVRAVWDGALTDYDNTTSMWFDAAANSTMVVAFGASSLGRFTGSGWTVINASVPSGHSVLGDDGLLYTVGAACAFTRTDPMTGVSTTLTAVPATNCNSFVFGDATRFVAGTNDGAWVWDGAWTQFLSGFTSVRPGTRDHVTTINSVVRELDLTQATVTVGAVQTRPEIRPDTTWDGDWIDIAFDGLGFYLLFTGQTFSRPLEFPPGGFPGTTQSRGDGALVVWGSGDVYRFAPTQMVFGNIFQFGMLASVELISDVLVVYGPAIYYFERTVPFSSTSTPWDSLTNGSVFDIIGDPRDEHLVLSSSGIFRYANGQYTYEQPAGAAHHFAGTVTDAIVGRGNTVDVMTNRAWSTQLLPAGCSGANDVAGNATGLYVAVTCSSGARVLKWNSGWTEVFSTTLVNSLGALAVSPSGTLYASALGSAMRLEPPSTMVEIGPSAFTIIPVSDTDVYMQVSGGFRLYDGTSATEVRLDNGAFAASSREIATYSPINGGLKVYPRVKGTTVGF